MPGGVPGSLVGISRHAPEPPDLLSSPGPIDARRTRLLVVALWLTWASVVWGTLSGAVSVTVGLLDGSLGVLGLGLNTLADVTGSAVLVWRFRAELHHARHGDHVEAHAAVIVAAALGTVSLVLAVSGVQALVVGYIPATRARASSRPGWPSSSWRRWPTASGALALGSRALRGDAALSGIGAAVGLLALTGLWLDDTFGWWWADRVAAVVVAGIAAVEAVRAAREW